MKKVVVCSIICAALLALVGCAETREDPTEAADMIESVQPSATPTPEPVATPKPKAPKTNFTNKYGTATTYCAHGGCTNYIAPSGDTNCCTTHSQRCLECGCYIDEDAMFCISCLEKALT